MRFFIGILILLNLVFSSPSLASHLELDECIEVAHCVREEWDAKSLKHPMQDLKNILENTQRTKITVLEDNYIHAEVTSRWMKYVDDLEIAYSPEKKNLQIRSESRVGESDLGVNSKSLHLLKSNLFNIDS